MTLGLALEKCAFESRWLTGYEPWAQRLAWNLTLASVCCKAACDAYNESYFDALESVRSDLATEASTEHK